MGTVTLEFEIKRGVVDMDTLEDEGLELVQNCVELCRSGENEKAAKLITEAMEFEWNWSNFDGDMEDYFSGPETINEQCTDENCSVRVSEDDGALIITAAFQFSMETAEDDIDLEALEEWLYENAAYSCGYFAGMWHYAGSDGDNVRIV